MPQILQAVILFGLSYCRNCILNLSFCCRRLLKQPSPEEEEGESDKVNGSDSEGQLTLSITSFFIRYIAISCSN